MIKFLNQINLNVQCNFSLPVFTTLRPFYGGNRIYTLLSLVYLRDRKFSSLDSSHDTSFLLQKVFRKPRVSVVMLNDAAVSCK